MPVVNISFLGCYSIVRLLPLQSHCKDNSFCYNGISFILDFPFQNAFDRGHFLVSHDFIIGNSELGVQPIKLAKALLKSTKQFQFGVSKDCSKNECSFVVFSCILWRARIMEKCSSRELLSEACTFLHVL